MVKIPSLSSLWQKSRNTLLRFPLQTLICLTAMSVWIWTNNHSGSENEYQFYKLIVLCNIAFTLSLSANLYAEQQRWTPLKSIGLQLVALVLCAALFPLLSPQLFEADLFRLLLFILAGHLLVSFSVYPRSSNILDFWHFNKTLFLRFITAFIFSAVLFAGLSVALLTIDALFNYNISDNIYFNLFIFLATVFNSLFFLAGVPDSSDNNTQDKSYPKVLKIFTQYVLIPLLTIYFGILVVYELKIAINSELPNGMVSILILGYAVFGILSYLLIYPISNDSGNEWMRQFSKFFFWLMLPLLLLLFVAIWVRTDNYGLTEMRYFIILLAIWLLALCLYFILHKSPSIQLIPISLFILALLSTYGPQSPFNLSKKSQQARLRTYIHQQDENANREKTSIVNYLVNFHGLTALQEFSSSNLSNIQEQIAFNTDSLNNNNYLIKSKLRDTAFAILSIDPNAALPYDQYISFNNADKIIPISSFNYAYWLQSGSDEELNSPLGKINIENNKDQSLLIKIGEQDSVSFDVNQLGKDIRTHYQQQITNTSEPKWNTDKNNNVIVPAGQMKLSANSSNYNVEINIQTLLSTLSNDSTVQEYSISFTGYLLISNK
ncbi:DUF4153 domain-containing protein [Albibacterium bauzanense]|uniref:Uncharacterized protein DUF4153 n=1 Tax=Albibacterium bauzanense TaxID=653929 RepID=A0A4R1LZS9_9SPHI|nr:DUF4153 domain-containing protein [Albibacterium bauzanense]TCK82759.1 uncharacterized protein DUF4153 [Albibacterium bauzanense]